MKLNRHFEARHEHEAEASMFLSASYRFLAYSSALKMEETCSFEIVVDFHRITQSYIPEDGTLHIHFRENPKFKITLPLYNSS
jgi:hypothetical protein